jgi:hypothetical protein
MDQMESRLYVMSRATCSHLTLIRLLCIIVILVFTIDDGVIDSNRLPVQVHQKMLPVCFTPQTVMKFIQNLNASGGGGPEWTTCLFFNTTAGIISLPLSINFNLSL